MKTCFRVIIISMVSLFVLSSCVYKKNLEIPEHIPQKPEFEQGTVLPGEDTGTLPEGEPTNDFKPDDDKPQEEVPEETGISINEDVLNIIGMTYADVVKYYGEPTDFVWWEGPAVVFEEHGFWCGFEDYYDTETTPLDDALCFIVQCDESVFLKGLEKREYSYEELKEQLAKCDATLEFDGEDEMDGGYSFKLEYNGFVTYLNSWDADKIDFSTSQIIFIKEVGVY